jgi:hypothetical protein
MPASPLRRVVLLRELGDFSLHPQGRPCGRPPAAAVLAPAATRRSPGSRPHRLGELGAVAARWEHRRSYRRRSRLSQSLLLSEDALALSLLARSAPMKGELA